MHWMIRARRATVRILCAAAISMAGSNVRADDDDDWYIPPFNPGPGHGGTPGGPPSPPTHIIDRGTVPYGVQTIYNIGDETGDQELWTRQMFKPSLNAINWVAFCFQNSEQRDDVDANFEGNTNLPGGGGPGLVSISLWEDMHLTQSMSQGELTGLLGVTDRLSIAENSTRWLTFHFPDTISLTPGQEYYLSIDVHEGYSVDVGGVYGNLSSYFRPYNFWYSEFAPIWGRPESLLTTSHEFLFAEGVLTEAADFDRNRGIDGDDLTRWTASVGVNNGGDADFDGDSDGEDFLMWQRQLGVSHESLAAPATVPEPATWILTLTCLVSARLQSLRHHLALKNCLLSGHT